MALPTTPVLPVPPTLAPGETELLAVHNRARSIMARLDSILDEALRADVALMCGMTLGYMLRAKSAEKKLKELLNDQHPDRQG